MTFNPNNYEHIYGWDLFDTFHNFFPEILYDEELFASETENYMRYRMSRHFPAMYVRQQNLYRLYNRDRIRGEVNNWRTGNIIVPNETPNIPHPTPVRFNRQRSPYTTPRTYPTTGSWRRDLSGNAQQEPRTIRHNRVVRTGMPQNTENILVSMITSEIFDMMPSIRTRWGEPDQYVDINVTPTQQQIEDFSEIKDNSSIPLETVCAVCQDHEAGSPTNVWRILQCQHSFHKQCIDTWFQRNVHCPVCRIDIRNPSQNL
jgi:hypothetical protein